MIETAENLAKDYGITREEADAYAVRSHRNAAAAWQDGKFAKQLVPVEIPQRKGDPIVFARDEYPRAGTTADKLAKLRPAFSKEGSVTAGNASQISDGGSAIVLMSERAAASAGVDPLGEVVSYGMVAGPDNPSLNLQPANAIRAALAKTDLSVSDLAVFELNEAFAVVTAACATALNLPVETWQPIVSARPEAMDFMIKYGIKGMVGGGAATMDEGPIRAYRDAAARAEIGRAHV